VCEALKAAPLVVALIGKARAERITRDACAKACIALVDGTRIVMTHAWLDEHGNAGPETTVTVTFQDHGNETYPKTKMTFLQEGFASKVSRDGHAGGWSQCFDLLEAYLSSVAKSL